MITIYFGVNINTVYVNIIQTISIDMRWCHADRIVILMNRAFSPRMNFSSWFCDRHNRNRHHVLVH